MSITKEKTMRKLIGILILTAGPLWAGGTTANLTVSSGTYQSVSMYSNDDGGNRQAIVLGDFSSSDTVRVDRITGMRVSLSTSALTTTDGVKVVPGAVNLVVTSTSTQAISGTVTAAQTTAASLKASVLIDGTSNTVQITGTPTIQGTVTVLPGASNLVITSTSTIPVSGSLSVNNPSTGTINSAVPGYATMVGGKGVSGNVAHFLVDSSTYLYVTVGAALPAGTNNIGDVGDAQGSTTSGQVGPLVQGAVTTSTPAYTTGQTSPLSLDTSGNLRVASPLIQFQATQPTQTNGNYYDVNLTTRGAMIVSPGIEGFGITPTNGSFNVISTTTLNVKIADVGSTGVPIISTNTLNVLATGSTVTIVNQTGSTVAVNMENIGGTPVVADPCETSNKTTVAISQTASTKLISAAASKKNHICSMLVVAATAEIFNVVEGTGTVCADGVGGIPAAIVGSTTTANGLSVAANGGFSISGGKGTAIAGSGTNVDTCLKQNSTGRLSGMVTYVQQ